jgi:ABC-type polysaccharide/polyol phosphate transport system ATPase subunit
LKDVSFSVGKGETLGIIGSNGAGKSTLLSLVAGTMATSEGTIETRGTISSLLELGAGFHPDLTGRENIFLYGAIMGLSREKMRERFDAIVEFSGITDFIDQPVKHYSSGMYVRLGFAVAVEVDPDILLIDEVLAVGDAEFQRKCVMKMDEFRDQGKTMLIISHDLSTIQSVSDRIILLDEGKVVGIGAPDELIETYESMNRKRGAKAMEREWGTGEVKLTNVEFFKDNGEIADKFQWGESLTAKIEFDAEKRIEEPVFGFSLCNKEGLLIYGNNTQLEEFSIPSVEGKGSVELKIDSLAMSTGTYLFSFSVHSADHKTNYHRLDNSFPIAVESSKEFEGSCHMPCSWRMP